ncbi:MAG: GerMN domain-containing protein [Micrococcales bacterium]|nr:GerMN domain-containing protein [Micrococcales bacterium]
MNIDDTGDRRGEDDPVVIGSGLRDVEARLRVSLRDEVDSIHPSDRLDAILSAAHTGVDLTGDDAPGRRRWLIPAAAAAAAAVVAGALWISGRPSGAPVMPAVPTATSTSVSQKPSTAASPTPKTSTRSTPTQSARPTRSASPTSPTSPTAVPTVTGTVAPPPPPVTVTSRPAPEAARVSVPVYYVGARVPGERSLALFREFVTARATKPVNAESKTLAALRQAVAAAPAGSGYVRLWDGVKVQAVHVTPSRITVTLSSGVTGLDAERAKLAVQQLVWTAQAAVGRGLIPVGFTLADGSTDVAPGFPASRSYSQPTGQAAFDEISMIWITDPARGSVVKAGSAVRVSGVATVFEGTVQWQLLRSGTVAGSGVAKTSIGAPGRGTYSFSTPALTPGSYLLRVYSIGAKDGSVANEARTTFTVR